MYSFNFWLICSLRIWPEFDIKFLFKILSDFVLTLVVSVEYCFISFTYSFFVKGLGNFLNHTWYYSGALPELEPLWLYAQEWPLLELGDLCNAGGLCNGWLHASQLPYFLYYFSFPRSNFYNFDLCILIFLFILNQILLSFLTLVKFVSFVKFWVFAIIFSILYFRCTLLKVITVRFFFVF